MLEGATQKESGENRRAANPILGGPTHPSGTAAQQPANPSEKESDLSGFAVLCKDPTTTGVKLGCWTVERKAQGSCHVV